MNNTSASRHEYYSTPALNAISRKVMRNIAKGYVSPAEHKGNHKDVRPVCGPFRAMMNAGDVLGRDYLQCDCPNPLGSKTGSNRDGVSERGCGVMIHNYSTKSAPIANCNTKYVYDSSDYIKFKKLQAQRLNFNPSKTKSNSSGYIMQSLQRLR